MGKYAKDLLTGITFENRILKEVLKEQEEKQRTNAIEQERRHDQLRGQRFTGIPWGRTIRTTYHGRSNKPKTWDAHRIRREYGLEKKKFASQWENCLWMIAFKSPITSNKIAEQLGDTLGGITGAMSYLYTALGEHSQYGPQLIKREHTKPREPYYYSPIENLATDEARTEWFEKAHEAYMPAHRAVVKAQKAKRRGETVKEKTPAQTPAQTIDRTQAKKTTDLLETKDKFEDVQVDTQEDTQEDIDRTETEDKKAAVQEDQARQLEELIGEFVVNKLKSMDLLKTAELKLTIAGGVKIRIELGFGS